MQWRNNKKIFKIQKKWVGQLWDNLLCCIKGHILPIKKEINTNIKCVIRTPFPK